MIEEELQSQGHLVVTVSSDPWDAVWPSALGARAGVIHIADPDRRIIERYGLEDESFGKEVARPATLLLDESGRVRWRWMTDDWRVRLDSWQVLELFQGAWPPWPS